MDQLKQAIPVVAGICWRGGRFLLGQRKAGAHLAGCWEFPGGKIRPGESPEAALKREWAEELDVAVTSARPWTFVNQEYQEKTVLLLFFHVEVQGEPSPQEGQEIAWVSLQESRGMKLTEGDAKVLKILMAEIPQEAVD
jgi:8-oxo-dGTP diphosphatase